MRSNQWIRESITDRDQRGKNLKMRWYQMMYKLDLYEPINPLDILFEEKGLSR